MDLHRIFFGEALADLCILLGAHLQQLLHQLFLLGQVFQLQLIALGLDTLSVSHGQFSLLSQMIGTSSGSGSTCTSSPQGSESPASLP